MKRVLGFCCLVVLTVGIVMALPSGHAQELSEAAQAEITTAVYLNQQAYDQYRNGDGDGVVGLARSFLGAGAQRVIVSLWAVPDQPTALLMTEFYRQWEGQADPAIALRNAMLTTRATYPAAKDWAGFTVVGAG